MSKISSQLYADYSSRQATSKPFTAPRKYDKLIHRTTQIPRVSVQKLIAQIDTNNDGWITASDIIQFSDKHHLFFELELAKDMIQEALSHRITSFKEQLKEPINIEEVLGAVQMHYKLNEEHKWVQNQRPFRKYWLVLLEAAGEKAPTKHDLPMPQIGKIHDIHELPPPTYCPMLNRSKTLQGRVLPPENKPILNKNRPEAGVSFNETINLKPIDLGITERIDQSTPDDIPYEHILNKKIQRAEEGLFPTVTFESKSYFKEIERLTRNPLLTKSCRNPIYTFIPDNPGDAQLQQRLTQKYISDNEPIQEELAYSTIQDKIPASSKYLSQPLLLKQPYHGLDPIYIPKGSKPNFQKAKSDIPLLDIRQELSPQSIPIFMATFQPENVETLKHRLARQKQREKEDLGDVYNPPSAHQFREDVIDHSKVLFKTRIKPDPLTNPHLMSEHDQRPQFAIERDLKAKELEERQKQALFEQQLGITYKQKPWIFY